MSNLFHTLSSNLGFALLGRCLLEKFIFTSFEDYVKKYILEPLKMTNTGFDITDRYVQNITWQINMIKSMIKYSSTICMDHEG